MNPNRELRVIVALAIVFCIVASLTGAHGEDKNPSGLRISTVDINRLQSEYKVIKNFKDDLDKKQEALRIQLQTWDQNPLLTAADQKTLADLNVKDKTAPGGLTAAEKTTQTKLIEQSRKLLDDYNRLQGTAVGAILPEDKKLLEEYVKRGTDSQQRSETEKNNWQTQMQAKLADTAAQTQKNVRDALKVVAKEKGFNLVLNSDIAPYAEFDCTDEVLKVLNK